MEKNLWQEIPAQDVDNLGAFLITSDHVRRELGQHIISALQLEQSGYSFDGPIAQYSDFKDGQIVRFRPLDPRRIHPNIESYPDQDHQWEILGQQRWFTASGYVLHLAGITSTGCYGDRTSYDLTVYDT